MNKYKRYFFVREKIDVVLNCCTYNQRQNDYFHLKIKGYENEGTILQENQLISAMMQGNFELVQKLLRSGVSPDANSYTRVLRDSSGFRYWMMPLHIAVARNDCKCVELLIKHGANVNGKDAYGVTALHLAAEKNFIECLTALLEAGAKCIPTNKFVMEGHKVLFLRAGTTPLHLAALNNNALCLKILMEYGADYNETDERGCTALYIAAEMAYEECVLTQLKNAFGRDILSLPDKDYENTPLHFAVKYGMIKAVKELLIAGSDVNLLNSEGFTPVHLCLLACVCDYKRSMNILKLLVMYGYNLDINISDGSGVTPLHYVAFSMPPSLARYPEMAKLLIAVGADINIFNHAGYSLINCEFNPTDSDATILQAILDSLELPPRLTFPTHEHAFPLVPDMYRNPHHLRVIPLRNNQQGRLMQTYLNDSYPTPPSLKHLCRISIRKSMGPKRLRFAGHLPLPKLLISYVLLGVKL